ncbi:hypothetical protein B0H11DRAFT_2352998 [Mycena galericulata]|nr:hypothetical protein B0H11DRAFT_2352998 [Mycena galericulata]
MANLAFTYRELGQLNRAEELEVVVLHKRQDILGKDHPEILHAVANLALTYCELGQLNKAEELEVVVLQKQRNILGEDHPDTLWAMANLALIYRHLGQLNKAEELEVMVLQKQRNILGEDHPETLRAMANLALTYLELGQLNKAEELEVVVLQKRQNTLGEDCPETLFLHNQFPTRTIAESDYPRLTQLLSAGLRNGASPRKLINLLGDVVEGLVKYTPRPSTDSRTLDIGLMSYVLGGRKLLYALSHGMGLPSLRTLRRYMAFTRIMPTIGTINLSDIIHNIEQVVLKPREAAGRTKLRRVSLLIDETALEERAVHFRHNDRVGGYQGGKAHLAKEMTVVAATCFGESGTYPILALPACKHMTAEDSTTIYQVVTKAWKMHAASQVGILWSWATDGDMMRRVAGYKEFLAHKLPSTSAIHGTLAGMVGLNLYTGLDEVTLDFDFKHIFKRICTLLRSVQGIVLNNGRVINPAMLARYLLRLPNQTPESINQMLFPHDPQHVAHAVGLLQAVIALGELDYGNMDADTCADVDALRLLGEVIKAVLEPFVNTSMSLTEQITSFSTFAHLSFTLFRVSRTQYMSNQLYGDSQTMVKNAMFCLAKQTQLEAGRKVGSKKLAAFSLGVVDPTTASGYRGELVERSICWMAHSAVFRIALCRMMRARIEVLEHNSAATSPDPPISSNKSLHLVSEFVPLHRKIVVHYFQLLHTFARLFVILLHNLQERLSSFETLSVTAFGIPGRIVAGIGRGGNEGGAGEEGMGRAWKPRENAKDEARLRGSSGSGISFSGGSADWLAVAEEVKNVSGAKKELGAGIEGLDGPRTEKEEKPNNLLEELDASLELEPEVEAG